MFGGAAQKRLSFFRGRPLGTDSLDGSRIGVQHPGAPRRRPGVEPGTHGCRIKWLNRSAASSSGNRQAGKRGMRRDLILINYLRFNPLARSGSFARARFRGIPKMKRNAPSGNRTRTGSAGSNSRARFRAILMASGRFVARNPNGLVSGQFLGLVSGFGSVFDVLSHRSKRAHASFRRRPRRRDFFWENLNKFYYLNHLKYRKLRLRLSCVLMR